jgi:hypothetical protein
MLKSLFKFGKEDLMMWNGIGAFTVVLVVIMAIFTTNAWSVVLNVLGLVMMLILPGYVIVKLYLNDFQIGENMTKNPLINRAIDLMILSFGCGVVAIIPLNFMWNYVLTMGGEASKGNIWGNVDEEVIFTGSAPVRAAITLILVLGVAVGYKIYQVKRSESAQQK